MVHKRFVQAGVDRLSKIGDSVLVVADNIQSNSFRNNLYVYGREVGKRFSCEAQTDTHQRIRVFKITYVGQRQKVAESLTSLPTDDLVTIWCEWNAKSRNISETGLAFIHRVVGIKRLLNGWRQWHDEKFGTRLA